MASQESVKVVLVGIGTVGGELLGQLAAGRAHWRRDYGVDIAVQAVVTRDAALAAPEGDLPDDLLAAAAAGRRAGRSLAEIAPGSGADLIEAKEAIARAAASGPAIVVDAATGEQTAELDAEALDLGAGVVLSNKAPLALPASSPVGQRLWAQAGPGGRLRYEATCGAGLPIFSTLRSLLDAGDEVQEILGAVSGTLGAIFSDIESARSFSVAVHDARERGYTEPDPRDDLSGLDVARKALILARTIGRRDDLEDIAVEGLVPERLSAAAGVSVVAFLEQAHALDADLAARAEAAQAAGQVLRYVAQVGADGPLSVGVRAVPAGSVLGALRGPENAVSIRTARYHAFPLGISGPGAGPAVTAAGMVVDILGLAIGPLRAGR